MTTTKIVKLNREEVAKYLGFGNRVITKQMEKMIEMAEQLVLNTIVPRYIYKVFEIEEFTDGIHFRGTNLVLDSADIKSHLKGCSKAIIICATVSEGIDNLIRRISMQDMALSVVVDCTASVACEAVGDIVDEELSKLFEDSYLTFRFGVGYGDLSLDYQKDILNILEAGKRIGVTLTTGNIMLPRKTITGIIGVSDIPLGGKRKGCAICNMKDSCCFRKEGNRCNE